VLACRAILFSEIALQERKSAQIIKGQIKNNQNECQLVAISSLTDTHSKFMANIDWARLVNQGRAKAIGVPWTKEEGEAVFILRIPAEYVRQGILTLEAYEKAKIGAAPLKNKEALLKEAKELGIAVTPDATIESLKEVIAVAKESKKPEEPKAKAKATPKPKAKAKKTSRKKK